MLFRHKLQVALLLFFILITAAASEETQFLWAVLPVMLSMLLLVDCMFLDSSVFMFDPDYKNWARRNEPQY